jgi:hypothetical protein
MAQLEVGLATQMFPGSNLDQGKVFSVGASALLIDNEILAAVNDYVFYPKDPGTSSKRYIISG